MVNNVNNENTTVFSNMLYFHYKNSDEISMALNFQYPSIKKLSIPLFQFYLPERVGTHCRHQFNQKYLRSTEDIVDYFRETHLNQS